MSQKNRARVALVTGGSTGLGQAFAQRLAVDGLDIVIADIQDASSTVSLVEQAGRQALSVRCDVSNENDITSLAQAIEDRFGHIDVVASNAGIYPNADLVELTLAEWRRVFAINVESAFLIARAFLPGMRLRGWGRLIFLTSTSFHTGPPGFPHYVATKGALIGFMHALATEYSSEGVTINAIAPSIVRTEGTIEHASEAVFEFTRGAQAIKRTQQPADVVGAMSFLASDDASFMTGQTLVIDGGLIRT